MSFDYDDASLAMQTIDRYNERLVASAYSKRTDLTLDVTRGGGDAFVEALGGRVDVARLG